MTLQVFKIRNDFFQLGLLEFEPEEKVFTMK